ncbi:MAG: hypothetical protein GX591_08925 [Planctomycetes bacterium]|nr:hypothetical protein [Planctomycetota bacterium]
MTTPGAAHAAPVWPYELAADTPCVGCGYDLRGLNSDSRCPECGESIERSLWSLLPAAPPEYTHRLERGTFLVLCGVAMGLVYRALSDNSDPLRDDEYRVGFAYVEALLKAIGVWLITVRPPHCTQNGRGAALRWIARTSVALDVVYRPAVNSLRQLAWGDDRRWASELVDLFTGPVLDPVWMSVSVVAVLTAFLWFGRLAERVPDRRLQGRTRLLMWGLGGTYGLSEAMSLGATYYWRTTSGTGSLALVRAADEFVGAVRLVQFLFAIAWLLLLVRYVLRFAACANAATRRFIPQQPLPQSRQREWNG